MNNDNVNVNKDNFVLHKIKAKNGDQQSQYMLGEYYELGNYVEKNLKKSFKYYQQAAEQGHIEALYKVGNYYEYKLLNNMYNEKVESTNFENSPYSDGIKLFMSYKKAAARGHFEAQLKLAIIYQEGKYNVNQNLKKAKEIFFKCFHNYKTDIYHQIIMLKLFNIYKTEIEICEEIMLEHDLKKPAHNADFKKSRTTNNSDSEELEGLKPSERELEGDDAYINTSDEDIDEDEDVDCSNCVVCKARNMVKYTRSMYNYAVINHMLGNLELAVTYYENSAYLKYPPSQKALGYCYKNGIVYKQSKKMSKLWYDLANNKNIEDID